MFFWFLHFQFLRIIVDAYYLQNFVTSSFSDDQGWLIKHPYNGAIIHTYNCGGTTIFGGYQIFGCYLTTSTSIMKYFRMPPHYKVRIDINLWKIDDWPSTQNFYINIDQWTESWHYPGNTGTNVCAGSGTDYSANAYNDFPQHTLNSIIVELYADCDTTNFWGLTDFGITLYECYQGCQFCLDSTSDCIMWILWKSYFDLQNLDNGLEGWIKNNRFGQFTYSINDLSYKMVILNQWDSAITYLKLPDHSALIIQFRVEYYSNLPVTVEVYINDEYKYGLINNKNSIKLGIYSLDGQVSISEIQIFLQGPINLLSCFDDNLVPFDGCFDKQESCVDGCKFCVKGECLMCDSQWDLNIENKNCEPKCGDQLITANEQCDDGNDTPYDGCHQCYFSCPQSCIKCLFGSCQACASGYYYSNGICMTNYDNLLIHYDDLCDKGIQKINYPIEIQCSQFCEICQSGYCKQCEANYFLLKNQCISEITKGVLLFEDGIHESQTEMGCYKCNNSCQIQCLQCLNNSYCLSCIDGWSLVDGICISICGDNQVALFSQEECDSNQEDCLNCRFVCPDNCKFCINSQECLICNKLYVNINHECQQTCLLECKQCIDGICYDNCPHGELNIDGICLSICGGGIQQQQEQCDDGNDIQFDGCYKCEYSCPLYCENCLQGICYECQQYFKLIYNTCQDYCGSGIKTYDEECDDGNNIDLDGCTYNCKIELEYKCQETVLDYSDCQYSPFPYMIVKFLNQTYSKYYLQITFSQAIQFNDNYVLQTLFDFNIDEVATTDYSINLQSNYQPIINQILNFQFQVEIYLFVSTNSSLVKMNIHLNTQAFNQEDIEVVNPSNQIFLKQYVSMSQSDIIKTKQLSQSQEVMIIAQGIGGVIVLVSGNFQIFVEILDNLQYQSNLKYINIIYPENLYMFFESTNLISIQPILNYLNIDQLYSQFLIQNFIESYAKLKFYNLNAHLITNLEFFFIQVILTFLFVFALKTTYYISFKIIYKIQTEHLIVFKLRSFKSKQLIIAIYWIYTFFHQIQVFVYEFYQDGLVDLLLANAWDLLFKSFLYLESSQNNEIISLIQMAFSYIILAVSATFITNSFKRVYSGKQYKLNYKYKAAYLLKQFFFCYFLICFQNNQLIQLLMLATINVIYLIALIFIEFNLQKLDKIQLIILEISIILFTFSSIFHLQDYRYLISEENKILLGFVQIYLLISSLLGIFIKQIIMIYYKIKIRCRKRKMRSAAFQKTTHLIFEALI